jgi:hypothetical protein
VEAEGERDQGGHEPGAPRGDVHDVAASKVDDSLLVEQPARVPVCMR